MTDSPDPSTSDPPQLSALRHDLRTLVGHVLGYAELVTLSLQDRTDLLPDMEKIRVAGDQILAAISDRLNTAALSASIAEFRKLESGILAPPAAEPISEAPVQDRASGSGRLLIVDDNEDNRYVLARRLQHLGHSVHTESGGSGALACMAAEEFDVVLLDIMMPDLDGREVLSRIKLDPKTKHIPVIMISALDEMQIIVRCIEMGAADYLSKPFDPILLRARVEACLRDKRSHDRELHFTTELQDSYRRLKEAERLRDDLTHMIVHDLRTPLSSIMTGMQTIPLLGDLNETQQEMVDIAVEGGQKLLDMITDLLNVEKMQAGAMTLDYDTVNAASLIYKSVVSVHSLAESLNLSLILEVAPELPDFEGDEDKLLRTLVNLLGNAIKFTPSGGVITVKVEMSQNAADLVFSVTDTGDGIPTDAFQKIFEKFGQVEGQRRGSKLSTGLGLTFCKMAVEAHHGHINVESAPGQGCTFSFNIPLTPSL